MQHHKNTAMEKSLQNTCVACVNFPCSQEEHNWFPGPLHSNSKSNIYLHSSQDSQRPKVELFGVKTTRLPSVMHTQLGILAMGSI